jgi:polysaccharide biosynthesis transport protein
MSLPDRVEWQARRLVRESPLAVLPAQPAAASSDFLDTMRKLFRQRYLIGLCAGATALLSIAVISILPTRYIAEARVLVGVPEPRALDIAAIISDASPDAERVQSEIYAVQSRDVAASVIDKLHLAADPEFNPALPRTVSLSERLFEALNPARLFRLFRDRKGVEAPTQTKAEAGRSLAEERMIDVLLSKLNVTALGRSNVISIQAESSNPEKASSIANMVADRYLAGQRADKVAAMQSVEAFLATRIAELRQQVEKSEQAVEDYRRQNNLYKGASAGVTSQQMTELNTQLILAQTAKAEADARLAEAQNPRHTSDGGGDSVPDVLRSPLIQALKEQQATVERRLADLSSSYGERHPRIVSARTELADINRKIHAEIAHTTEGLRHEAATAAARYQALRQNFDQLQAQMGNVNEKSIHLEALERDATVNRNLLENVLSRAKETMGQQELQQANAKLISPAAAPAAPGFPPKTLLLFLGTLAGVLVGIMTALLRESSDRTFRLSEQVETATGLPVLALIPSLRRPVAPAQYILKQPMSPFAEAMRKLDIGLQMSETVQSPKVVLFSSATPGEGKTALASALGRMAASHGRRVLLVDCDWRSPSLHRTFHCSNRGGLAALLDQDDRMPEAAIQSDEVSGADILPAGHFAPSLIHRLLSPRMEAIISTFARSYDLIILDSAPVLVGAEVLSLCRLVDKVVYTVRWGVTRREVALEGLKQIIEAQADVAGVVLSRVDARRYRHYAYGRLDYEYRRPSLAQSS